MSETLHTLNEIPQKTLKTANTIVEFHNHLLSIYAKSTVAI